MPKLVSSLNQLVTVACPAYFGDEAPRHLVLVDIEVAGLWFSGEALNQALSEHELTSPPEGATAAVFFPFEQIAYLVDPRQFARPLRGLHPAVAPESLPKGTRLDGGHGTRSARERRKPASPKAAR